MLRGRGTSPIVATASAVSWTRSSGRKTAPNRKCGPRSSTRSGSSSGCSALPRCAIAGSKERSSPHRHLRNGQSVHRAAASLALPRGIECPHCPTHCRDRRMPLRARPVAPPSRWRAQCPRASPPDSALFRHSLADRHRDVSHMLSESATSGWVLLHAASCNLLCILSAQGLGRVKTVPQGLRVVVVIGVRGFPTRTDAIGI